MRTVNRNLILLGVPALLIFIAGIALFVKGDVFWETSQAMAPQVPQGKIGDVEGYVLLIGLLGSGISGVVAILMQVIALLITGYGGIMVALNLLARGIYRPIPERILAYRIIMGFDFFILLLPLPSLFGLLISSAENGQFSWGLFLCMGILVILTVFGCRNTYTWRITGVDKAKAEGSL